MSEIINKWCCNCKHGQDINYPETDYHCWICNQFEGLNGWKLAEGFDV